MSTIKTIQKPIEKELLEFNKIFEESILTDHGLLKKVLSYILQRKGKQLRPILVFLSAGACGGITKRSYNAATLVELMHTATLIHDDVVDESYIRRNIFSINGLWKNKIAVLMGDYLLARGLLHSVKHKEFELLEIVSEAVDEMSRGELLQIKKSRQLNITEEEYFEIIEKKTASLIASCTKIGALSANADKETVSKMFNFGRNIGIAFQIKDDLFDYESENLSGKPPGNDIKEKKMTLPLIFARKQSSRRDRKKLLKIIKSNTKTPNDIENLVTITKNKGGFEYAENKMMEYRNKALEILNEMPESEYLTSLKVLVDFIITRKS
ncbi:MAG: polyprenyl synthetase family protein [Salinivirgaceae bacterium]|nr:polyprenyl synthetase family protein [Salinivirgaceae bacterium]MDD4746041.1 polyprenyl synthetase family protein [Salinivirgaceae bacterium]MDY0281593.1 polyprenyl synthetase family protein [Salinivirgaceae bacterium]